ncbi:hypothetical protein TNCV_1915011 [Trichonephila clavipes]|nr:hypothetical protein TNCV_1915011 [Trichonephila clavipes]
MMTKLEPNAKFSLSSTQKHRYGYTPPQQVYAAHRAMSLRLLQSTRTRRTDQTDDCVTPAILINHHPKSINESGVTSTRCYPNRQRQTIASSTALLTATIITAIILPSNQEAPSPHKRQHPRTLRHFIIWDGGLI